MKIGGLQTRTHTLYYSYQRKDETMTTVYVLTLATDYEGECLTGVYASHADAEAACETQLIEMGRELMPFEDFIIRPMEIGVARDMRV